jgi:hypothetical protein
MKGKGCRAKGTRGETEFVEILNELELYSQRVLGSGAFAGAKSDVKVGIQLNADGSLPDKDESSALLRVEVKNRKSNPEYLHTAMDDTPFAIIMSPRQGPEFVWEHYNQDQVTKAVAYRRRTIPHGAKAKKDYNQIWMVCLGIEDFAELVKKAYAYDEAKKTKKRK